MADAQSLKILEGLWASGASADRQDPVDAGITRTEGFGLGYEQIGSGDYPERTIFNQKMREWDGWASDNIRTGGLKPWDTDVTYYQYARVASGRSKYVATVATGPDEGNATDPTATGQTIWALY